MKLLWASLVVWLALSVRAEDSTNPAPSDGSTQPEVETIVCVRHGEKPPGGLGQLNCRGLNRALALPNVLLGKFGTPQYIFAPNPAEKSDHGNYYYVRPLMTIEPTAIRCGMPVDTQFGFTEIEDFERELQKKKYHNAVIFVAWEHVLLDLFAKDMVRLNGGSSGQVPAWNESDFDSIFVIKITHAEGGNTVTFTVDHEGLNNLSDNCP